MLKGENVPPIRYQLTSAKAVGNCGSSARDLDSQVFGGGSNGIHETNKYLGSSGFKSNGQLTAITNRSFHTSGSNYEACTGWRGQPTIAPNILAHHSFYSMSKKLFLLPNIQ